MLGCQPQLLALEAAANASPCLETELSSSAVATSRHVERLFWKSEVAASGVRLSHGTKLVILSWLREAKVEGDIVHVWSMVGERVRGKGRGEELY